MVSNTINVGSWLMLNALIPNSLPEQIIEQYKKEFVVWPKSSQREKGIQLNHLFFALKSLRFDQQIVFHKYQYSRATIKTLLESQFSRTHVQTLIELSKTIRLKSIELLTTKSGEGGFSQF
jgi:hypothetical protein